MRLSDTLMRAVIVVLFCYAVAIGATFTGVTIFEFRFMSLGLLALLSISWLLAHWRRGWQWYVTPLDGVLLLWAFAFALSLLANLEVWRRIVIGLWFVGLYLLVWYGLQDAIANRAIKRDMLVDSLLFSGLVVLFFAYFQTYSWFRAADFSGSIQLPRPVSVLGNANTLGAFLVVLIPLALGRLAAVRMRLAQVVLILYVMAALIMLFLTFSRGAWVGVVIGGVVWFGLLLAQYGLLTPEALRAWWRDQHSRVKALVAVGVVGFVLVGVAAGFILVRSLQSPGRSLDLRTYLYEAAIAQFLEKPLTGYGLFTFGRHLPRFASMPNVTPHSHAHNTPLHIAAELGLPGLIALVATLIVIFIASRRNWRAAANRERFVIGSAIAAVAGFATHHLLDTPAMLPAIALLGMIALVLALAPVEPMRMLPRWRLIGHPVGMLLLPLVLLGSGVWTTIAYEDYTVALAEASTEGDYRAAAGRVEVAISADPAMSLYYAQQAFLLGMANSTGDLHAGLEAIALYERVIVMEPYYAPYRANLGALYWSNGRQEDGIAMLQTAAELAPEAWQFYYDLGLYAEALDDTDLALTAYQDALNANPDADLSPVWGQTDLQQSVSSAFEDRMPAGQVAVLLEQGAIDQALTVWEQELRSRGWTSDLVLRGLIALEQGDRDGAVDWFGKAEKATSPDDRDAWLGLGAARLAQFDGDNDVATAELEQARESLERGVLDADYRDGLNVAYVQFLSQGIARQFLPQLYYPTADPVLLYLLENNG